MDLDPRIHRLEGDVETSLTWLVDEVRERGIVTVDAGADRDDAWFARLVRSAGEVIAHDFLPRGADPNAPYSLLERDADTVGAFIYGGAWHQNLMFLEAPPDVTVLYGKRVTDDRNFTAFVDLSEVSPWLSQGLVAMLRANNAIHSTAAPDSPQRVYSDGIVRAEATGISSEAVHPCYVDDRAGMGWPLVLSNYVVNFEGWHAREALPFVHALRAFATHDEFVIRYYWRPGRVLLWDNRRYLHRATVTHYRSTRTLWRADLNLGWGLRPRN